MSQPKKFRKSGGRHGEEDDSPGDNEQSLTASLRPPARASGSRGGQQLHVAAAQQKREEFAQEVGTQVDRELLPNASTAKNGMNEPWAESLGNKKKSHIRGSRKGSPDTDPTEPPLNPPERGVSYDGNESNNLSAPQPERFQSEQPELEQGQSVCHALNTSEEALPQATAVQMSERENVENVKSTPIALATKFTWLDWSSNKVRACLVLAVLAFCGAVVGVVLGIKASQNGSGPSSSTTGPPPSTSSPTQSPTPLAPTLAPSRAPPTVLTLEQLGQTLFDPGTYSTTGPRGERLFGWTVDISSDGKRLAATAPYCMCVFIYDWNESTSWTRVAQITNTAGPVDHITLSGYGSVVALGIPEPDDQDIGGLVQTYHEDNGSWKQLGGPILGVSSGDRLGGFIDDDGVVGPCDGRPNGAILSRDSYDSSTLALSENGHILAVGSPRANYVRILRYDEDLLDWVQFGDRAFLVGEDGCDNFGTSVDMSASGLRVIVGAPDNIGNALQHFEQYNGNVRVFQYEQDQNTWVKIGQDIDGNRGEIYYGEHLGTAVSISEDGSTIVVSANARSSDDSGLIDIAEATQGRNGYAKVYRYEENRDEWIQQGNQINFFHFGLTDGINDEIGLLSNALDSKRFPVVTKVSGDGMRVAVSVLSESLDDLSGRGLVRIYERRGDSWQQVVQPVEGTRPYDHSGRSIALSYDGSTLAIGSPEHNGDGPDFGQVRVFEVKSTTRPPISTPSPSSPPISLMPNVNISVAMELSDAASVGWRLQCGGNPLSVVPIGSYNESTFDNSFGVVNGTDCMLSFEFDAYSGDNTAFYEVYFGNDTLRDDLLIVTGESDEAETVVFQVTANSATVTVVLSIEDFAHETGWSLWCGGVQFVEVITGTLYSPDADGDETVPFIRKVMGIEDGSVCQFYISDTFGDGLGEGGFYNLYYGENVTDEETLLATGGNFGSEEVVNFTASLRQETISRPPSIATLKPTTATPPIAPPTPEPTSPLLPTASPAPTGQAVVLTIVFQLDYDPMETSWSLECGTEVIAEVPVGSYTIEHELVEESFLVEDGSQCLFVIEDSGGDGLDPFGDSSGPAFYKIYYGSDTGDDGILLAAGQRFNFLQVVSFTASPDEDPITSNPTFRSRFPSPAPSISGEPTMVPTISMQPTITPAPSLPFTVKVVIQLDRYPQETGWQLTCGGIEILSVEEGTYTMIAEMVEVSLGVESGAACAFLITDSYGDGLFGFYQVSDKDGNVLVYGDSFDGFREETAFTAP